MDNPVAILNSLKPLFKSAEQNNLWFHCSYQDLWFSPEELRANQSVGRFIWGPDNWTLRNPQEKIAYLERQIVKAQNALNDFKKRVK